jgi:hypothetical protein
MNNNKTSKANLFREQINRACSSVYQQPNSYRLISWSYCKDGASNSLGSRETLKQNAQSYLAFFRRFQPSHRAI